MRNMLIVLMATLALAFAACSSPGQPGCMPGTEAATSGPNSPAAAGGQRGESKPETGRTYGVPNPTSTYARGNADVDSDYKTESRQAGAITNPKSWTADTRLISSAPMSVKYAGQLLETYALELARAKTPEERESIRADMAALVDKVETHQSKWIGAIAALAPSFDRCVLIQIDGSGSSTGGQPAVNPDNVAGMATGVKDVIDKAEKVVNGEFESAPSGSPSPEGASAPTGDSPDTPPAGAAGNPLEDADKQKPPANGGGS